MKRYLITPKMKKDVVEEAFAGYNKVVSVPKKMYLTPEEEEKKQNQ